MLSSNPEAPAASASADLEAHDAKEHDAPSAVAVASSKQPPSKEQELSVVWKRTLTNLVNYQTGGVLWYATAIAGSGWVGHLYAMCMVSCSFVSACMLSELLAKFPSVTSYGALCNAVLSSQWSTKALQRARSIMDTLVNLEMFLYLCSTLVTLAQSLVRVVPMLSGWPAIVVTSAALLPTTLLKDFAGAAQLSALGILATAVNLVLLVYVCFAGDRGTSLANPSPDLQAATDVQHSVASLGLYCIAYTVQSSLPSITFNIRQASLKHGESPDQIRPRIRSVAYCSLLPTFLFNTVFSSAAYMIYGPDQDILPVNFRDPIISAIACSWVVLAYYSKGPRYLFILSDSLGKKVILNSTSSSSKGEGGHNEKSSSSTAAEAVRRPSTANSAELGHVVNVSLDAVADRRRRSSAGTLDTHFSDIETASDMSADECTNSPGTDLVAADRSPSTANSSVRTQTSSQQELLPVPPAPKPVVATTVTFKYATPAVSVEERPYRQVVGIRVGLLILASGVAYASPSLVGLLTVGGTILAACTMFVIPAFLLAADRGWINSALFDTVDGGIPAVAAGLVDASRRHKFHIFGYKFFVFFWTPALVALSIMATYCAVLIY